MSITSFPSVATAATSMAGAVAYLVRDAIGSLHIEDFTSSEDGVVEATADAIVAIDWLFTMGHPSVVTGVMEGVEAGTWWLSPDEDMAAHIDLVAGVFAAIRESHEAAMADAETEDADEETDSPELTATKDELEKLFALS